MESNVSEFIMFDGLWNSEVGTIGTRQAKDRHTWAGNDDEDLKNATDG